MNIGTRILIEKTCHGCRGAEGKIGVVTDGKNNHGLWETDLGYNVAVSNGGIWRINNDAKVKILVASTVKRKGKSV